MIKEY